MKMGKGKAPVTRSLKEKAVRSMEKIAVLSGLMEYSVCCIPLAFQTRSAAARCHPERLGTLLPHMRGRRPQEF
jgi:hypothetical protein